MFEDDFDEILFNDDISHKGKPIADNEIWASDVWKCARRIHYERQIKPTYNINIRGMGLGGEAWEGLLKERFSARKRLIEAQTSLQNHIETTIGLIIIRGRLDLLVSDMKGNELLIEAKTSSPFPFHNNQLPKREHVKQALCYMKVRNDKHAMIWYASRSEFKNWKTKEVYVNHYESRKCYIEFDQDLWDEIEQTVYHAVNGIKNGVLPPKESDDFWCSVCPFVDDCANDTLIISKDE